MAIRRRMAYRAFYPGDCRRELEEFLSGYSPPSVGPSRLVAAVAPHAGWRYSGAVAARALATLASASAPTTIVLLGAYHRPTTARNPVDTSDVWETPFGDLAVSRDLSIRIAEELTDLVEDSTAAHAIEHSLEVQAPMVRHLFPGARIVPILVLPEVKPVELGEAVSRLIEDPDAIAIASTDLTHYGERFQFTPAGAGSRAHAWMRENDARILDLARRLEAENIPAEAESHWNACGPGALAATVAFARARGAREGIVLERTDSHEVTGGSEPFTSAVGYAGLAFG